MRALLTDLDRTLTGPDLALDARALRRLQQLRDSDVRVVVVTGRTLDHLIDIGLHKEVDGIVAENGAIVAAPGVSVLEIADKGWQRRARDALGALDPEFRWGRVLGSGLREIAPDAAERLSRARVPHALSFNAEEVMLLPHGVDKARGARRMLSILGMGPEHAWAIGDGENDVPLLQLAARAAVPGNAHPAARAVAEIQLQEEYAHAFLEFTQGLLRPA